MKDAIIEAMHAPTTDRTKPDEGDAQDLAEHDVAAWAAGFLGALADVRPSHHKQVRPARRS